MFKTSLLNPVLNSSYFLAPTILNLYICPG